MLLLGGILNNATVRTTPRYSWWITAQHLLSTSPMATIQNPEVDVKNKPLKKITRGSKTYDSSLLTAAFKSMQISQESSADIRKELNDRINSAKNVNELLNVTKDPEFDKQLASAIIHVLFNWISTDKVKINDIVNDRRYIKICDTLEVSVTPGDPVSKTKLLKGIKENTSAESSLYELLQVVTNTSEIEKLSAPQMINVLTFLATKQKRSIPVLQVIAAKIVSSTYDFSIKELGDILYCITVLNFYDEVLLQNLCKRLLLVIPKNERTAVIRSIFTSLGLMRYRDETLINLLSSWVFDHKNALRSQDINSFLKTLACLGYVPENFDLIFEDIIKPMTESDMCESDEWLDIIWSLSVLNKAESEHYESVLNPGFLNRINDSLISRRLKILNTNAAAQVLVQNYKGPLIPEDSKFLNVLIKSTKDKTGLSNSIVSALKILLPTDATYLDTYVNTNMGFLIDAVFCMDKKGSPVPLNSKSEKDNPVFRIAVIACSYQEFCRGVNEVIGPIKFHKNLLENSGYKVLLIPYTDVKIGDSLTMRVTYIKDKIKLLVQNVSTS